jgi:flavodoxin
MTNPRIAIVCSSRHHGNTRRVALAIAEAAQASLFTPDEEVAQRLDRYELVGFGSGIYFSRHDARILELVASAPLVAARWIATP